MRQMVTEALPLSSRFYLVLGYRIYTVEGEKPLASCWSRLMPFSKDTPVTETDLNCPKRKP